MHNPCDDRMSAFSQGTRRCNLRPTGKQDTRAAAWAPHACPCPHPVQRGPHPDPDPEMKLGRRDPPMTGSSLMFFSVGLASSRPVRMVTSSIPLLAVGSLCCRVALRRVNTPQSVYPSCGAHVGCLQYLVFVNIASTNSFAGVSLLPLSRPVSSPSSLPLSSLLLFFFLSLCLLGHNPLGA